MPSQNPFQLFESEKPRLVKKGEVLIKSGQKASEAFYVVKGCLRSYMVDAKGNEHIYQFAPEDWIISDLEFFKNKGVAFLTIDAVENSEVKSFPTSRIFNITAEDPVLVQEAFNKFQNRVYALQQRVIQLLAYSAEERYQEFIKTYPNLSNRLPLKMIASYLGLTPESLSRVRKELVKGR